MYIPGTLLSLQFTFRYTAGTLHFSMELLSFPKEMQKWIHSFVPGAQGLGPVILGHVEQGQHDPWSQDLDPGLEEKSMYPSFISFGKECSRQGKSI